MKSIEFKYSIAFVEILRIMIKRQSGKKSEKGTFVFGRQKYRRFAKAYTSYGKLWWFSTSPVTI